jgi:hypothetical protein
VRKTAVCKGRVPVHAAVPAIHAEVCEGDAALTIQLASAGLLWLLSGQDALNCLPHSQHHRLSARRCCHCHGARLLQRRRDAVRGSRGPRPEARAPQGRDLQLDAPADKDKDACGFAALVQQHIAWVGLRNGPGRRLLLRPAGVVHRHCACSGGGGLPNSTGAIWLGRPCVLGNLLVYRWCASSARQAVQSASPPGPTRTRLKRDAAEVARKAGELPHGCVAQRRHTAACGDGGGDLWVGLQRRRGLFGVRQAVSSSGARRGISCAAAAPLPAVPHRIIQRRELHLQFNDRRRSCAHPCAATAAFCVPRRCCRAARRAA